MKKAKASDHKLMACRTVVNGSSSLFYAIAVVLGWRFTAAVPEYCQGEALVATIALSISAPFLIIVGFICTCVGSTTPARAELSSILPWGLLCLNVAFDLTSVVLYIVAIVRTAFILAHPGGAIALGMGTVISLVLSFMGRIGLVLSVL